MLSATLSFFRRFSYYFDSADLILILVIHALSLGTTSSQPFVLMRVFTEKTLTDYGHANPRVREELKTWAAIIGAAQWKNFNELKADYPATDYIGNDRYVFNLKGNHYRIIAMIFFGPQRLYVRGIFTHTEYTKHQKKLKDL